MTHDLSPLVLEKLREQVDRLDHLKLLGVPIGTPDLYHWRGSRRP